jgi:transposase-like protein
LAEAPSRHECERRRDTLCARLRAQGQEPAAACLERDWEDFVVFYDFPQEHWLHVRTSNPIESIFSGVRLRTNASKRLRVRENALYLVFKLVLRLSLNWRGINAPNQLGCDRKWAGTTGRVCWGRSVGRSRKDPPVFAHERV